jgi:hypothetical protein
MLYIGTSTCSFNLNKMLQKCSTHMCLITLFDHNATDIPEVDVFAFTHSKIENKV